MSAFFLIMQNNIDNSIMAISVNNHNSIEKGFITIKTDNILHIIEFFIYFSKTEFKIYIDNVINKTANKKIIICIVLKFKFKKLKKLNAK